MSQEEDALAQLYDHVAGTLYDIAIDGQPESDSLYESFQAVSEALLSTFDIAVIGDRPLKVEMTLK